MRKKIGKYLQQIWKRSIALIALMPKTLIQIIKEKNEGGGWVK